MIVVTGEFRMPPEALDAARAAMGRVIAASRAEPGCLDYIYAEDILEPGLFRVIERWTDRAALSRHFEMPHMKRWLEERAAMGLTGRQVTAHAVTVSEAL
ncbi:putative quinol monooxygenase [Novosphingobium guangzhouense]|uniref:Antibiotic biosynthesis monooxygenase n=1 Tax=Novosphingobium guangzhouense TaxID=1850347 RepID=A0A2K2G0X3_9SPHN|nr:putative quinol monooxygenase [Novosphingobium guangzhouense]PNU04705.1 antibiotic biosynthesis monooxygenase [Novosphingobium guangzhouense]